jgi:tetraacyldisaccharide 4'-kinase
VRPAVLLRDYRGDEAAVHRFALPEAIVVATADRVQGARKAAAAGARVLVLDDAFQHLRVRPDVSVVLVSAESLAASPSLLPAGPWRERWDALRDADLIVLSAKTAGSSAMAEAARTLRARAPGLPVAVARLHLTGLRGLCGGAAASLGDLAGRRVLAACGIADPSAFAAQLRAAGADVVLRAWRDHHAFSDRDVAGLRREAQGVDHVVVTMKDAVKLRARWPADAPEPLVAELGITWERGRAAVDRALQRCLGDSPRRVRRQTDGASWVATALARREP